MILKKCNKCRQDKELICFSKHSGCKFGVRNICKICARLAGKKYRSENREKCILATHLWWLKNKERSKIVNKKWVDKNKDKVKIYISRYREKNSILTRLRWHEFDTGEYVNDVTVEKILELLKKQNHKCVYCSKILDNFHIDHKIPKFRGGKHEIKNIQLLCPHCNHVKRLKTHDEFQTLIKL